MKAITQNKFGNPEVLHLEELPIPTPNENEVLVKIHAAAIHSGDWHLMLGEPFVIRLAGFGVLKPKSPTIGGDLAGTVESTGSKVIRFKAGDRVFGGRDGFKDYGGGLAEYARVPQDKLELIPEGVDFEQAAPLGISASTALLGLQKGRIETAKTVLIIGASGGVGSYAVQIAKTYGAEVTGVCSTGAIEMVQGIGADHVVDYKKEDFTQNSKSYDLIFDTACFRPISETKKSVSPGGIYIFAGGSDYSFLGAIGHSILGSLFGRTKVKMLASESTPDALKTLADLVGNGKIKSVIDRRYSLDQAAEAMAYLGQGHTRGKVVLKV